MDAVGPEVEVALCRQIALLPARMLLAPRLPRFREGRLLRRAMVDADRPGASPAFAGPGSCRRAPPVLLRGRRLRCPSGRGEGAATRGSFPPTPTAPASWALRR